MEFLYNANRVFVCMVLIFLLLNVLLRCLLATSQKIVLYAYKVDIYAFKVPKKLNKYVLGLIWTAILFLMIFFWSGQSRHMFNKITEYDIGAIESKKIIGEWVKRKSIIRFEDNGSVYYNQNLEETLYGTGNALHWGLEGNKPYLYLYNKARQTVKKYLLFEFDGELRICDNFSESGRIIGLGFKKLN